MLYKTTVSVLNYNYALDASREQENTTANLQYFKTIFNII